MQEVVGEGLCGADSLLLNIQVNTRVVPTGSLQTMATNIHIKQGEYLLKGKDLKLYKKFELFSAIY